MSTIGRLIGTAEECFLDFATNHPELAALQLLAEFCRVNVAQVQKWQRGQYFPRGEQALRIRCFLHLAGYEVIEMQRLPESVRSLGLLIGVGLVDPRRISEELGYTSSNLTSLWRILVAANMQPTRGVSRGISEEVERHRADLDETQTVWRRRIVEALQDDLGQDPQPTAAAFDAAILVAFDRSLGTAVALARHVLAHNAAHEALGATRNGQNIRELMEVLAQMLHEE